ncbi:F-box protein At5g07610-like [Durio zibethinus]|uniref:F-box protein At5g07610-like n=1 Tax=Durio zibethinus TaxID=66656 RepID=A0A6P5Z7E6_DURZI|nr:F-box protein At5g07610-like [Durio zibethinus]
MVTTRSSRLRLNITSAEMVANSEDLLKDILLRLPIKTLIKFKIVSKPWLSLISCPHFGLSYTHFLQSNYSLKPQALFLDVVYKKLPSKFMVLRLNPELKRLPLFDFIHARNVRILQSCYGLILCVSQSNNNKSYFLCNPVTKKFKMFSFPVTREVTIGTRERLFHHVGVNLAFDPFKSPYYKIISIWQDLFFRNDPERSRCYMHFIDIYSSETDSWSVAKIKFAWSQEMEFDRAVLFNGAIHWDSSYRRSFYFDPYNECLKQMPMPTVDRTWVRYLGESGGHMHIVAANGFSFFEFKIFEMAEDYSNWFLKYRLDLDAKMYVLAPKDTVHNYLLSCAVQSDEVKGDSLLAIFPGGFAISYNLVDGTVKRLRCSNIQNYGPDFETFRVSCRYFETLACV